MREIKFRAWCKDENAMYYDAQGTYDYMTGVPATSFGDLLNDEDWLVMQYTGLKDKNGTEIYEGDLLFSSDWCCNCEVIWEDGGFTLKEGDTIYNLKENLTDDDGNYLDDVKVIGNIYENKELIK